MITHVYKNNNVTVKYEPGYDDVPETLEEFVCAIVNETELNGYDVHEQWDYYLGYPVELITNGERCIYYVGNDEFKRYQDGYTTRLVFSEYAPLFTLPRFYKSEICYRVNGKPGTLYTLCNPLDDETREEMRTAGCTFLISQCEYAPEIKHPAVFVPNGVRFSYC